MSDSFFIFCLKASNVNKSVYFTLVINDELTFDIHIDYLCVYRPSALHSVLILYFDLTTCCSYIVKPVRLSLVYQRLLTYLLTYLLTWS